MPCPIFPQNFRKIRPQTNNRQTNRQTNKNRQKHNLLGGGKKRYCRVNSAHVRFIVLFCATASWSFWPSDTNASDPGPAYPKPCYEGGHWQFPWREPVGRGLLALDVWITALWLSQKLCYIPAILTVCCWSQQPEHSVETSKGDVRRTTKSADFCGRGWVVRQNRWTMTHGRYFCLLLHTLSASTTAECRSQNNTCITFFLHLMNENNNKHNK